MATSFSNKLYNEIQLNQVKSLKDTYVEVEYVRGANKGKKAYVAVSDLKEYNNDANQNQIKSLSHLQKVKSGKLRFNGVEVKIEANPKYYSKQNVPKVIVTNSPIMSDNGLTRALLPKEAEGGNYFPVKLAGDGKMSFAKLEDLGVFNGGVFTSFRGKTISDVQTAIQSGTTPLFVQEGSKYIGVDSVFATTFNLDQAKYADGTTAAVEEISSGRHTVPTLDKDDNITKTESSITPINQIDYIKNKKASTVEFKTYTPTDAAKGNFISLTLKGETKKRVVPVAALYVSQAEKAILNDLKIGDSVLVKTVDGKFLRTEPLTAEDVNVGYNLQRSIQASNNEADRCADNSALLLADGSLRKEKEVVKPIAYSYVDDAAGYDAFDAYVVTINPGTDSAEDIVVDKSVFKDKTEAYVLIDKKRVKVNLADARKIKRCAYNSGADVVQTTSNPSLQANKCKVITPKGKRAESLNEEERAEKLKSLNELYTQFLAAYKDGSYNILGKVSCGDTLVELAKEFPEQCRFLIRDYSSETDYGNNLSEYSTLVSKPLVWNGKKLVGGPTYNAWSAIKKDFSNIGMSLPAIFAVGLSWGGILASMVATFPVIYAALAGAGVAAIALPVVRLIRKAVVERTRKKYENKVFEQRKQTKNQILVELSKILDDTDVKQEEFDKLQKKAAKLAKDNGVTSDLDPTAKAFNDVDERKLLLRFEELEQKVKTLSSCSSEAEFKMEDGKGEVNENNAHLYVAYKQKIENLQKEIKKLKKIKKRTQEQNDKLIELQAELEDLGKNCTLTDENMPADEQYLGCMDLVTTAKKLILVKYYGQKPEGTTYGEVEMKAISEYLTEVVENNHLKDAEKVAQKIAKKYKKKGVEFGQILTDIKNMPVTEPDYEAKRVVSLDELDAMSAEELNALSNELEDVRTKGLLTEQDKKISDVIEAKFSAAKSVEDAKATKIAAEEEKFRRLKEELSAIDTATLTEDKLTEYNRRVQELIDSSTFVDGKVKKELHVQIKELKKSIAKTAEPKARPGARVESVKLDEPTAIIIREDPLKEVVDKYGKSVPAKADKKEKSTLKASEKVIRQVNRERKYNINTKSYDLITIKYYGKIYEFPRKEVLRAVKEGREDQYAASKGKVILPGLITQLAEEFDKIKKEESVEELDV